MQNLMNHDDVLSFIETQLLVWPMSKRNYDALTAVERRDIEINGYNFGLQYNPARIISTGAKIDKSSVERRPCFLCRDNRPAEQIPFEIIPGWDMLLNPFPIFPVHLTIVSREHRPQTELPSEIVEVAEKLPGMVVFFNGAKAGASAPDHLHLQAVLKDELPLVRMVEKAHPSEQYGLLKSSQILQGFPYLFFSGVVAPGQEGLAVLLMGLKLGAPDAEGKFTDQQSVNIFFWLDDKGILRFITVPRKAHRPTCYYAEDTTNRMVSPGCIDMAGMLILPRENDFREMTSDEVANIFSEVAFKSET